MLRLSAGLLSKYLKQPGCCGKPHVEVTKCKNEENSLAESKMTKEKVTKRMARKSKARKSKLRRRRRRTGKKKKGKKKCRTTACKRRANARAYEKMRQADIKRQRVFIKKHAKELTSCNGKRLTRDRSVEDAVIKKKSMNTKNTSPLLFPLSWRGVKPAIGVSTPKWITMSAAAKQKCKAQKVKWYKEAKKKSSNAPPQDCPAEFGTLAPQCPDGITSNGYFVSTNPTKGTGYCVAWSSKYPAQATAFCHGPKTDRVCTKSAILHPNGASQHTAVMILKRTRCLGAGNCHVFKSGACAHDVDGANSMLKIDYRTTDNTKIIDPVGFNRNAGAKIMMILQKNKETIPKKYECPPCDLKKAKDAIALF